MTTRRHLVLDWSEFVPTARRATGGSQAEQQGTGMNTHATPLFYCADGKTKQINKTKVHEVDSFAYGPWLSAILILSSFLGSMEYFRCSACIQLNRLMAWSI